MRQNFLEEEIRELFLFLAVERALSEELSILQHCFYRGAYLADFYKELHLSQGICDIVCCIIMNSYMEFKWFMCRGHVLYIVLHTLHCFIGILAAEIQLYMRF
jgi:hypothetical protein